jgi:hypothetical protein
MTSATPDLSVVLLCRNERRYLPQSLAAFIRDRPLIRELIVVDDASTDGSLQAVEAAKSDLPPLSIVVRPDRHGVVANLNEGLHRATGTYILFAAADDVLLPGFFTRSMALLAHYPQAALCSTRSRLLNLSGADLGVFHTPLPLRADGFLDAASCRLALHEGDSWFMGNTTIFRRDALLEFGGFDSRLGGFADALACWALALRHGACFIPDALGAKRDIGGGVGSSIHGDAEGATAVWQLARHRMETEFGDHFPPTLVDRMESRWRFNTARSSLYAALTGLPGPVRDMAFALGRGWLLLRHKPFDALLAVRRHLS